MTSCDWKQNKTKSGPKTKSVVMLPQITEFFYLFLKMTSMQIVKTGDCWLLLYLLYFRLKFAELNKTFRRILFYPSFSFIALIELFRFLLIIYTQFQRCHHRHPFQAFACKSRLLFLCHRPINFFGLLCCCSNCCFLSQWNPLHRPFGCLSLQLRERHFFRLSVRRATHDLENGIFA